MSELTDQEKIQKLKWQIFANLANVAFCYTTFFGSFFIIFLNELGFDKSRIGFLLSLFPFCGLTALFTASVIARSGFKRIFLIFFALRIICVLAIIPTPWIIGRFGLKLTFVWITLSILSYALCKALAETAYFPWQHEIIPNSVRGKFTAINTITAMVCSIFTTMIVGFVVGHYVGLNRYMFLMIAGTVGGLLCVRWYSFCPGGDPIPSINNNCSHFRDLYNSVRDKSFALFTAGLFIITISLAFVTAFIPLYMKEQIGLSLNVIIWLDIAVYAGSLVSGYLWGWAADRYGSKPVMTIGPLMLFFYPLLCLLLPRHAIWSTPLAFGLTFVQGLGMLAWGIGSTRYLFVTLVPEEKKTHYLAIYYATVGLAGGLGPLLAGKLLEMLSRAHLSFYDLKIEPYAVVFILGMVCLLFGVILLQMCPAKGDLSLLRLMGLFFHGNPLLAIVASIYAHFAKTDISKVNLLKLICHSNSPINNIELLHLLQDPSIEIRIQTFSAIIKRAPDPILQKAIIENMGSELSNLDSAEFANLDFKKIATKIRDHINQSDAVKNQQ